MFKSKKKNIYFEEGGDSERILRADIEEPKEGQIEKNIDQTI